MTFPNTPKSNAWRIDENKKVKLASIDPAGTPEAPGDGDRDATEKATKKLREDLRELQGALQGEQARSVLVILQAMDTGGKDGTVKNIFMGVNPVGMEISSFGVPSEDELAHDFLWRIHAKAPPRGKIGIFNRSQYEDVLAVRVRNIAPASVWKPRYELINEFERNLDAGGTVVVKIMLHISFDEQRARLQARIDRPDKRWKFRLGDIEDRKLWGEYQKAYEDALSATSTAHAPWFVIPADKKWYRDFAVLTILNDVLRAMKPKYPEHQEFDGIVVP